MTIDWLSFLFGVAVAYAVPVIAFAILAVILVLRRPKDTHPLFNTDE